MDFQYFSAALKKLVKIYNLIHKKLNSLLNMNRNKTYNIG